MFVFVVLVLGLALRGMTPEERARVGRAILAAIRFTRDAISKPPAGSESFYRALAARTRWAVITPTVAAGSGVVFVMMLLGRGELADPATLVGWGGSVGPRTTNGEWWRLGTAVFVHASVLHLLADIAGLAQVGLVVERLVGRLAFGAVVAASALLAGLWSLTMHPVSVHTGAAGAIYGIYGLLAASLVWGLVQRAALTVPLPVLKGLWPGVALFLAYNALTDGLAGETMQAGLVTGFTGGILVAGRVVSDMPPARRVYAALAATAVIVVLLAAPLRGLADATGEVARVRDTEARTSRTYDEAVDRFKRGRVKAEELAMLADRIVLDLQAAHTSLASLENVPADHQAMVSKAWEYLRLRQESWRLRAEALRSSHPRMLQQADAVEHAALAALESAISAMD